MDDKLRIEVFTFRDRRLFQKVLEALAERGPISELERLPCDEDDTLVWECDWYDDARDAAETIADAIESAIGQTEITITCVYSHECPECGQWREDHKVLLLHRTLPSASPEERAIFDLAMGLGDLP
jgi:hypothetical protein